MSKKHLTDQRFTDFELADSLKEGLAAANFEFCTPIQAQSLPVALSGKDVAGQAQTGTGKTVAFLLACCQHLITHPAAEDRRSHDVRAVILAPTRELAIQIHKDAQVLSGHTGLKLGLVYGGTGYESQKTMLGEGVDILIGTPGRLIDFFKQKLFGLKHVQVAILDEADRMFDLGFIKDIRFLLRRMPSHDKRLNMLFSATLSYRVMELAYEHMNNPEEIKIESDTVVADKVTEFSYYPAETEKLPLLVNLLKEGQLERVVVFVNTRHTADKVSRTLDANDISTATLSGDVPQKKREKLLENFKSGKRRVLVATDVAARGLHIPAVSHVFNFDLPQDPDDYIHRIGRTARAGASGEAISFVCEKYAYSIMDIEEHIGHSIPKKDIDNTLLEDIEIAAPAPPKPSKSKDKKSDRKPRQPRSETARDAAPENPEKQKPVKTATADPLAQDTAKQTVIPPAVSKPETKAVPSHQPPPQSRFSRRFGEVPLIG